MTYKIEKNIPMPNEKRGFGQYPKYPFADMKAGDSFAVPVDPESTLQYIRTQSRIAAACVQYCKSHLNMRGYTGKFTVRINKREGIVRVWCIA